VKALVFRHNLARKAVSAIGGRVDRHDWLQDGPAVVYDTSAGSRRCWR